MAEPQWLNEDELRAWHAFVAAGALINRRLDQQLKEDAGITHLQYEILVRLNAARDRAMRMSELAGALLNSKSGLTYQITQLEKAGLVARRSCVSDVRAVYAVLTDAGRAMLERAALELPGVVTADLAANFVADFGAGHYTWDLVYPDRMIAEAARRSEFWRDELLPALDRYCVSRAALGLETVGAGARDPEISAGVKRTALFRVLPGVEGNTRAQFERDTLEMAAHIPAILNWRLSRAECLTGCLARPASLSRSSDLGRPRRVSGATSRTPMTSSMRPFRSASTTSTPPRNTATGSRSTTSDRPCAR